jgi:cytochrome P450
MVSLPVRCISLLTSQTRDSDSLFTSFPVAVSRLSLRPFTFSNGVTIPAGTFISVPATAAQRDGRSYENPEKFDGFRFAKLREGEEDSTTSRYQAVSVSNEHLPFGVGRHTW